MAITKIPGWSDNIGQDVPQTPLGIYKQVELVYKCANLVANSVATAPVYLYNNDNQIDWLYKKPLRTLLRRIAKDTQLYGKSYVLKLLDGRGNVKGLRRLNPNFMQHDVIGIHEGYPVYRFTQRYNHRGKAETRYYEHHEVIYIPLDCENNDVDPDVYPAKVALGSGKVRAYLSAFGEQYLDKGGVGITILHVEGEPGNDEMGKFEAWLKRRIKGISNVFSVIPLRQKVTATQLTPVAKDLAIKELDDKSRKDILDAFGVPEGMVDKSSNYASADVHNRQFWDMTIKPLVTTLVDAINEQLFGESRLELRPALEELPVYQVDESRRSAALANMVNAGVSVEAAWWSLGYADLPDDIPLVAALPEPTPPEDTQNILDSGGATPGDDSTEEGQFKSSGAIKAMEQAFAYIPFPNHPDILRLQRWLKGVFNDDRIEWQASPTFHITLAFAGMMDDFGISKIVPMIEAQQISLELIKNSAIGYFDTPDGKALHLKIANTSELSEIQTNIYRLFKMEGYDISEFSVPAQWNPHITLGYLPDDIDIEIDTLNSFHDWLNDVVFELDTIIIGRDDYDPAVVITAPNFIKSVATVPSMFTHLDKWRTKCENQLRHKKSPNFSFDSELIPVSMKAAIEGALSDVQDYDDIRHVFETAVELHHSHGYV